MEICSVFTNVPSISPLFDWIRVVEKKDVCRAFTTKRFAKRGCDMQIDLHAEMINIIYVDKLRYDSIRNTFVWSNSSPEKYGRSSPMLIIAFGWIGLFGIF